MKVFKTKRGYEIVYQERLAKSEPKVFTTKKETERYLTNWPSGAEN